MFRISWMDRARKQYVLIRISNDVGKGKFGDAMNLNMLFWPILNDHLFDLFFQLFGKNSIHSSKSAESAQKEQEH